MAKIGTEAVHTHRWPNGVFAGPYYYSGDVFVVVYESVGYQPGGAQPGGEQPGGGVGAAALFKSTDGGATWIELDRANRPEFTPQPLGCPGFGVDSDGTNLHVLIPVWKNTGGAPSNDVRIDYYEFNMSTGLWEGLTALGTWDTRTTIDGGYASSPIQARLQTDGDLVLSYAIYNGSFDITYWRTYSGGWGSQTAVSKTDASTCPLAMVRGAGQRMHTLLWRPTGPVLDMTSYTTAAGAGSYQESVGELATPEPGLTPGPWPNGQPAYSSTSNEVAFPFIHGLTLADVGVRVARSTSTEPPSWTVDDLVDETTPVLPPDIHGTKWMGAPGAVYQDDVLHVMWGAGAEIVHVKKDGTWTTPALLTSGRVPALFGGEGVEEVANLTLGIRGSIIGVYGDAQASTSLARYAWYREVGVGGGGSGGGNYAWFG